MKRIIHIFVSICFVVFCMFVTTIVSMKVGLYPTLKENYIQSAMTTLSCKKLATSLFDKDTISEAMKQDFANANQNSSLENIIFVDTKKPLVTRNSAAEYKSKMKLKRISGNKYKGYVFEISDPSKIFVGAPDSYGGLGLKLDEMCDKYDVKYGVNAGGFSDRNGHGKGGIPTGIVVSNGKILFDDGMSSYNIVGFNNNNVLVIGKYKKEDIGRMGIRDAVSFRPPLVINGEGLIKSGNGGWGLGPRTAIGQRRDGSVIFVVIDGRQLSSLGASLREVQDIMLQEGACNASCLDGGSSTTLVYENEIVNHPSSSAGPRYLPSAFLIR